MDNHCYCTRGTKIYTDLQIPVICNRTIVPAEKRPGRHQVFFTGDGNILLTDRSGSVNILGPAVILVNTSESSIKGIDVSRGNLYNLVFSLNAVNSMFKDRPDDEATELFFFEPFYRTGDRGYIAKSISPELNIKLKYLFEKLDSVLNGQGSDYWPCLTRSFLIEILILLYRVELMSRENRTISLPETGTDADRIFIFLHTHYNEKITIEDMTRHFATNRTTLNNLIQKYSGMSAKAYLNHIRMEVAAGLLRNTELAVNEISDRIGIDDITYFSRIFKKKTGITPSEYREQFPSPY